MDFDFNDDQEMLRESVRRWVEKAYTFDRRRQIVKAGGFAKDAWREIAELGLLGLQVPEAHGGMGFGPVDAMVVMEELGRGIVLEPYAPVALVAVSLLAAGRAPSAGLWLQGIAEGREIVVLAHQERSSRYRLAQVQTVAKNRGGTWQLSGTKIVVPAGAEAGGYIVPARVSGDAGDPARIGSIDDPAGIGSIDDPAGIGSIDDPAGIGLYLVSKGQAGVTVNGYGTLDGSAAADLVLADADAIELLPPGEAYAALERAVDIGIAAVSAEAVGAMERLVAVTAEYMNTRKQFGVPIASFQALRHRMADVKMQLELARSMSYFATLKLDDPAPQRRRALSQAKMQLGESMRFVGQQCVQLHGGIGVTEEYLAGHYFKRLTAIEMTYGDTLHHLGEVSARMQPTAGVFA